MDEIRLHQRSNRVQKPRITEDDMLNEGEYDDAWPDRLPSSSRRYYIPDVKAESGHTLADSTYGYGPKRRNSERAGIPPRRSAAQTSTATSGGRSRAPVFEDDEARHTSGLSGRMGRSRRRFHWLVFVGIAMFVMIIGWIAFNALSNWWQITQDDWHYGRPRTYQVDMVVGHNDSASTPSHFIAENLNSHIMIVEIPGGDTTKAKIYLGPTLIGSGQDLTPVTLTFKDVNGDGKLDMIVNVQGAHFVFLNQNGQFVAAPGQNGS